MSNNTRTAEETVLYEKAVTKINMVKPDFVVITGDLVNDRSNKAQWDEFRRITDLIDPGIKVYLTPGNHDIGQEPDREDIDEYKSMFGYDRFSFEYKKIRFIGFNSCLIKAETPELENEQFEWLMNELSASSGAKQTILFCHHPFFLKDPLESETYSNIKPETRQRYLSMFSKYGVDVVFAGHLHNNAYGLFGEIQVITTSAVGKQLGGALPGLRLVRIDGKEFNQNYFPLDSL
jgi:3',5'-cyclic AMP phosphodiesterase CpdA